MQVLLLRGADWQEGEFWYNSQFCYKKCGSAALIWIPDNYSGINFPEHHIHPPEQRPPWLTAQSPPADVFWMEILYGLCSPLSARFAPVQLYLSAISCVCSPTTPPRSTITSFKLGSLVLLKEPFVTEPCHSMHVWTIFWIRLFFKGRYYDSSFCTLSGI